VKKNLTQKEFAELIKKKRNCMSLMEDEDCNLTLKALFEIVKKDLGGNI